MIGITKAFGAIVANRNVNLYVEHGEIRALLGENGAGKTTLMNILYGMVTPDSGEIEIGGEPIVIRNPRDALRHGVGMVHQHFMLVPNMTVAENVALAVGPSGRIGLDIAAISARAAQLSGEYGLGLKPDMVVENLSVGMRQRLEILKLLCREVQILVLDEPTSVLTPIEWEKLAEILRTLANAGRAIIFITHKLEEVFSIARTCTVMRDGADVATVETRDVDARALARLMVGRDVVLRLEREQLTPGEPVIEVRNLSLEDASGRQSLRGISFVIREREILGIAGVEGNGQRELVEVLAGVRRATDGEVVLQGIPAGALSPREVRARDVGVITADRHVSGIVLDASLAQNLMLKDFRRSPFARRGILGIRKIQVHCAALVHKYAIRTPDLTVPMWQLSGGNQQRTVLARELQRQPRFLIAAQPTRGLDVGAIEFVYEQLMEQRRNGCAMLLISTELEEILTLSDRIAVMVGGRFVRVLDAAEASLEEIGLLMAGELASARDGAEEAK
jgi:ABC-type uncharacterized transport system ATPase subunit